MADLLARYLSGDCQAVRDTLRRSINANSAPEKVAVATAVADEFVNRAIANLSRLHGALLKIGYEFSDPAEAFVLHGSPRDDWVVDFEKRMGRMPLIASRWYRRIRSVNFTQTYGQLTDRTSPLSGLGWSVPFIVQSLEKAREHWSEHCRECEEDFPESELPRPALLTGGCASNNECKGFELPSFRFDDVLYDDGGGESYFGDEIARGFRCGGFPVLTAHGQTLRCVHTLYGEPDREHLSKFLPADYDVL